MPSWRKIIVSGSDASLNSLNVATNVVAQSFTGSLFGTSSWANNTISSSYAVTSSYTLNALSSSFASTASYVNPLRQNVILTGSLLVTQSYISTVDYIDFTLTANPAHNEGRIHWIDDTKTLNVDTDVNNFYIELGHQNVVRVNNQNSFTLTKGTVVYINGENGQRPTVATASFENDGLSAATLGLVAQDINSGQNGYVVSAGIIRGINTNAYAPGTMLYLSSSGQFSSTAPQSPLHEVRLGKTITQATAGTIFIDVMNGYEIGELHDVLINGQQNGDLIVWNSGSRVFQNTKILSGSYGVSGSLNVSQGITGSLFGTSSYAVQSLSASLAESASYYPIKVSGSTIYSADPATSGFNTTGAVIIGPNSVGQNSTNSQFAVMVGAAAGQNATTSQYAVMIGTSAGNGASNSEYGVMLGRWAGSSATNASSSVMVGREAGRNATNTTLSTFVGAYAGFGATNARSSTFIGQQAGYNASSANDSVFVGTNAGYGATAAVQSLFYGPNAGFQASAATLSTFIGNESGYNAISGSYSVFIGNLSGQNATSASFSTFIGRQAGQAATKASSATFIGGVAGYAATFANNGVFVGNSAGESAASASYSILIGNNAGATSNAANTIGSYNTVIGTGISVPRNATRALNIGGLIFGTGSYASANLDAFSGSANGKVGINQPNPQYSFDVSGSGNYTDGLTITGSVIANSNVLITGSLTVGATTLGSNENTLVLGPKSNQEGGQLLLQSPLSASFTSASMFDVYADTSDNSQYFRILRGSNAGSDAIVAQFNLHTKQFLLPTYNSLGAFSGTPVAALGVSSTGAVITIQTGSQAGGSGVTINNNTDNYLLTATGTSNTINGESNLQFNGSTLSVTGNVLATSITSSGAFIAQANNAMYFRGGDDAEFWDINVANTVGIYGQQNSTIGSVKLGSGGGTISGKAGNIGINTTDPTSPFTVNGNTAITGSLTVSGSLNVSQGITGSLLGTSSYATQTLSSSYAVTSSHALNVSIRTSGSSLYSHNPLTTNFSPTKGIFLGEGAGEYCNADYSNFIGDYAGANASGSTNSNFIGTYAGFAAYTSFGSNFIGEYAGFYANNAHYSNFIGNYAGHEVFDANYSNFIGHFAGGNSAASSSNFIGNEAGNQAYNSHYSNFIGYRAGNQNNFADYSNFIGWNVGNNNNLGRNNILIGTNIGLPSGSRDRINIAGLIYGTGSYSNTTSPVFSGSANGRIGINQPNPRYSFDVSGSGNYTNGLTVTGSFNLTDGINNDRFTISQTADGTFTFNSTAIGEFLVAGPQNIITTSEQQFRSLRRGAYFDSQLNGVSPFQVGTAGAITGQAIHVNSGSYEVGIGTTSPTASLHISGSSNKILLEVDAVGKQNILVVSGSGNIGINQPNPQKEFDISGSLRVSRLSTSLSAPTTSGTTKMVITDTNGDLSFDNIPTGGNAFPYTGSAIISGSLIVTGSVSVLGTAAYRKVVENQNSGYTITSQDFGKTFICNSSTAQTFNLPSANTADIGFEVTIIKYGEGKITIDAPGSDVIQDSGAGGTIYCSDTGIASITLLIARTSAWVITSAVGTWITTD